ncbi:hypothetical protein [Phytohabitans rumicis]|uniref:DUF4280 domain-containing protein n=1 Tax=Phytohabitans rumicis TaxID=1076125 RepID=A0A6V8L8Q4_9ACTN|nr:hypothetical protein [Phytohabitans rumicis]GFJ92664.1 hypothetical protein Prum_063060 [Phytohabitans rumicis]
MPGFLLHQGAKVQCAHAGDAQPSAPDLRVKVDGQSVTTQSPPPYQVAGCSLPPNAGGPCVTAEWTVAALRVKAGGKAVLLADSQASCLPTGTPVTILQTQTRVKGT